MKCISLLLCVVMIFGLLPMPATAAETVASGISGSASWTLEDGVFTISGGAMDNYSSAEEQPWHAYATQIQKVVIGSGVPRVGDYAFDGCENLSAVEIGSDVHTIGRYAFANTTSLTEVVLPKNVTTFCDGMFYKSGLKQLYIYARKTSFEGFNYIYRDEDTVLPLDTVIYCYSLSHAYYHIFRDVVELTDDLAMNIDNGNSTIALDPNEYVFVRDLWAAADTADGLVFDYTISMKTADIVRIHNEMVEEYQKIGSDYYNDGKLFLEAYIQLETDEGWVHLPKASAMYSIFEYNLRGDKNNYHSAWGGSNAEADFITITGDAAGVTVRVNATMQELEAYVGAPVNQMNIYISVEGESYRYNHYYDSISTNHSQMVESVGMSLCDARMRESGAEIFAQMTLDRKLTVEDFPWIEGASGFYEPVSRHYVWGYTFARMRYEYDEDGNWVCIGESFENLEGDGIATEDHSGILYGGVRGTFDAGSNASVSIREMLSPEELAFVETLKGVEPMGNGGEARIELNYTLYLTFADGSTKVLYGMYADEISSIAGVCLHTCSVCGLCTSEELLACNSQYGWRTNECICETPSPSIESSCVDNAVVIPEESFCYYGEVTARVETFDAELAVTTDYFKAIIDSVGSSDVAAVFDITLYNEYGEAIAINEWGGTEEYITLTIPVSAEIAQAAYAGELVLYHVDSNGIAETVAFTVDTVNNTLTFTGYSFSPYVLVETVPYYGRSQLAGMTNSTALLYAYDQIAAGVAVCAESIDIYNGVDPLSKDELRMVMDAYIRDYAHHFWLGNSYSYSSSSETVLQILPQYIMTGTELEDAQAAFDAAVEQILSGLDSSMTEFEKELYLHDVLAGMVTYEFTDNAHNAYGALVEGKAVCEGYAEALQYLLQRAGIQSFIATGSSINPGTGVGEAHAWNYVRIDGQYYHVDLTWNDQDEYLFHAYFNQTDAIIQEDHAINETAYPLPVCDATDAMYFTGKDTYLDSYTANSVGMLLQSNGLQAQVYIPGSVDEFLSWYSSNILTIAMHSGVSGGFSYGYTWLGREVIIYLKITCDHTDRVQQPGKAPDCVNDGYKEYFRCACGKYYADTSTMEEITNLEAWKTGDGKLPALGHEWGQWYVEEQATCTEDGVECRDCSRCDHSETRPLEAAGHEYVHIVTDPTCREQGYTTHTCANCGDSYVDSYVNATGHSYGAWYTVKDATCTEDGQKRHDCANCDHFKTEVIAAIGHNYNSVVTAPTCTEQGYTTHTCANCGDSYVDSYVDALGHNHVVTDSVAATCTEDGYITYTCHCGDSYTEVLEATGHSYVDGACEHCGEADPDATLLGDANGDGTINYLDAMLIAQYYVGDIGEEDLALSAADVNGDGTVNYLDAMMIAQYYVGDIEEFPRKG